jgi:hypothetical protein
VFDDRCLGGATCICPSRLDDNGVCVTPAQKAVLCSGDLAPNFQCTGGPAGGSVDGAIP